MANDYSEWSREALYMGIETRDARIKQLEDNEAIVSGIVQNLVQHKLDCAIEMTSTEATRLSRTIAELEEHFGTQKD